MGQVPEKPSLSSSAPAKPKLREQLHAAIRARFYSRRTEESYWYWIRYFIYFHGKRHPAGMGGAEVTAFLNWLATDRKVAAATQNQALNALLFLYKHVLDKDLPWFEGLVRAKRPVRLPVVLNDIEVQKLLARLEGTKWLIASFLYGSGLRLQEALMLRVKDIDFAYRQVVVRDGKGGKDRVTMLPESVVQPLQAHLGKVRALHRFDCEAGYGGLAASRACPEVPARRIRVGLAVRVSVREPLRGPRDRCHPAPPRVSGYRPSGDQARGASRRNLQAGELPHTAAFIRHAPPAGRLRHPHGAGAAGPLRRFNDDDLHPRAE
jgi:integrase